MRVIRFNNVAQSLKLEPESFDDLYLIARVVSGGDVVEAKSLRRFRASEGDVGEQKEVTIRLQVERAEVDKSADMLRITGKIVGGHPEEFIRMGSYHTINLGAGEIIDIQKPEWKDYLLKRIKQAMLDSKKPKLGIIVMDDELATIAYVKGYGIEILSQLYSKLSKRMKEKDFEKQKEQYFNDLIKSANNMKVDIVVLAGPGFTKDDLKKHIAQKGAKVEKKVFYTAASDAERSGVREVMQSDIVADIFEKEHVRKEFEYLNIFLQGVRTSGAFYGNAQVREALESYRAGIVLVNDSVLDDKQVKELLDIADQSKVRIEIFNSEDDAGMQLKNFKDIAAISKLLMSKE